MVHSDSCRSNGDLVTEVAASAHATASCAPSHHVPVARRERAFERAGYQREYGGPDGTRSSSRTGLEVEHTPPFAVYGTHDERHIRVLCPVHSLHAAKKYYGSEFIERKIEAARREQAARCGGRAVKPLPGRGAVDACSCCGGADQRLVGLSGGFARPGRAKGEQRRGLGWPMEASACANVPSRHVRVAGGS